MSIGWSSVGLPPLVEWRVRDAKGQSWTVKARTNKNARLRVARLLVRSRNDWSVALWEWAASNLSAVRLT